MSDRVPGFVLGNRVRIMQTSKMECSGLANKTGIIDGASQDGRYIVLLDIGGGAVLVKASNLMRNDRNP